LYVCNKQKFDTRFVDSDKYLRMFLFKFNPFTEEYYKYDTDDVDVLDQMFDEKLHDNNITPVIYTKTTCAYCHTCFSSRNLLFKHLGYMGIDIRKPGHVPKNQYDDRLGDEYYPVDWKRKKRKHADISRIMKKLRI